MTSRTGLPLRALLFVPGDSERKITKGLDTNADILILDLEDAVAPAMKDSARSIVSGLLSASRRKPLVARVNAFDTTWHLSDVASIVPLAPDAIMLPKCESVADVIRLDAQIATLEASAGLRPGIIQIIPLVTETAASLLSMDYRGASERLAGLAFAGEDLAADLGVSPRDEMGLNPLLVDARRRVAIAAAAAQVPAIDTPFPDPRDAAGLSRETSEAARLGFAGKMCIHPGQIDAVRSALCPPENQIVWSRAVVAHFASASDNGVTLLDGKMIDRAHLRLAERCLSRCTAAELAATHAG
ncbi:MAG: CoA ester lyase [Sphingopyxis sp.]|nr:CoA ester lyase [Sphingopyxis sp.]